MWETVKRYHEKVRGYRTVIWHSLYGVPCVVLWLYSQLQAVDITPLLALYGLTAPQIAAIGAVMALIGILLRFITKGPVGEGENH